MNIPTECACGGALKVSGPHQLQCEDCLTFLTLYRLKTVMAECAKLETENEQLKKERSYHEGEAANLGDDRERLTDELDAAMKLLQEVHRYPRTEIAHRDCLYTVNDESCWFTRRSAAIAHAQGYPS